ncbi:MAG TPA: CHAT domain-containing protein [Thermoanaerobaculia bacterium]|jgi:hypothetical protein|nr:CHAT domain-containing protein [Thermoanaerobaculia bacterium]
MPNPGDDVLDLSILDAGDRAVVLGRWGSDVAIGRLAIDATSLGDLESFRDRLDRALRGAADPPPFEDLKGLGNRLFEYAIRDDLRSLYDNLPESLTRIHLLSNQARIQRLPWEYLGFPQHAPGHPSRERSVVRIVPTRGRKAPEPKKLGETVRVLFVSAAPRDQNEVDFESVREAIQRAFQALMPPRFTIEAVDGANRASFRKAVAEGSFDILHFSGHGRVDEKGQGRILLVNRKTSKTDELPADQLCTLLAGKGIRLVVLSACETATGNFADDFATIAEALVQSGIPAVVANQLPVTNRAMASFVGPLYEELLQSGDIDRAVAEGRIALDVELESFEWGIPTLYRHYAASQLYQP